MKDRRAPVPEAKLRGLRQALEEQGTVTFHQSGAIVELVDCETCKGAGSTPLPDHPNLPESRPCGYCDQEGKKIRVLRGYGGHRDYTFAEMHRAYKMALFGPEPYPQPQSDKDFGDAPPF